MTIEREHEIAAEAAALLEASGCEDVFPTPLSRVAHHLKFSIETFPGGVKARRGDQSIEVSGAVSHKERKIFINSQDKATRMMFTAAHEIGHIVLHGDDESIYDFRGYLEDDSLKEQEANQFAACLLMPKSEFMKVWKSREGDLERIANYFGVSKSAAKYRVGNLRLS